MTEKFNPFDPKYKKVEDLPTEEQERFVNLADGGFVRKDAAREFKIFQSGAEYANKRRPLFKKMFFLDRVTPIDMAHADALENESKSRYNEDYIARRLRYAFEELFADNLKSNEFRQIIDQHAIDTILSADRAGRIPAEALARAINVIYRERGELPLSIVSIPIGSHFTPEEALQATTNIMENNNLGKGVLYVTEQIGFGATMEKSMEAFRLALTAATKKGLTPPNFYGFFSVSQERPIVPTDEAINRQGFDFNFYSKQGAITEHFSDYSGLERTGTTVKPNQDFYELPQLREARERLIRETSDYILRLYNKEVHV